MTLLGWMLKGVKLLEEGYLGIGKCHWESQEGH